jgi:hypothetical protein
MSNSRDKWPFNSSDLLRVPFNFVPKGDPDPVEWLALHPGAIRIPARFVPRPSGENSIEGDWNEALDTWVGRAMGSSNRPTPQPDQTVAADKAKSWAAEYLAASGLGGSAASVGKPTTGPGTAEIRTRQEWI